MNDAKTPAEQLRDLALAKSRAHDWVRELADGVGARLAGMAGDAKAGAWAKAKMAAGGLPNVHTQPVTVPHWERGIENREGTFSSKQRLALTAPLPSPPPPGPRRAAGTIRPASPT